MVKFRCQIIGTILKISEVLVYVLTPGVHFQAVLELVSDFDFE